MDQWLLLIVTTVTSFATGYFGHVLQLRFGTRPSAYWQSPLEWTGSEAEGTLVIVNPAKEALVIDQLRVSGGKVDIGRIFEPVFVITEGWNYPAVREPRNWRSGFAPQITVPPASHHAIELVVSATDPQKAMSFSLHWSRPQATRIPAMPIMIKLTARPMADQTQ